MQGAPSVAFVSYNLSVDSVISTRTLVRIIVIRLSLLHPCNILSRVKHGLHVQYQICTVLYIFLWWFAMPQKQPQNWLGLTLQHFMILLVFVLVSKLAPKKHMAINNWPICSLIRAMYQLVCELLLIVMQEMLAFQMLIFLSLKIG